MYCDAPNTILYISVNSAAFIPHRQSLVNKTLEGCQHTWDETAEITDPADPLMANGLKLGYSASERSRHFQ